MAYGKSGTNFYEKERGKKNMVSGMVNSVGNANRELAKKAYHIEYFPFI